MIATDSTSFQRTVEGRPFNEFARIVARDAALAATVAVNQAQVLGLPGSIHMSEAATIAYGDVHSGDAPIQLDVLAHDATWGTIQSRFHEHGFHDILDVGEESGSPVRALRPGTFLGRQDPLDGSTNAATLWANWSSVVCIDEVRDLRPDTARARHHAGAISVSNGWVLSWVNDSYFDLARGRYHHTRGRVFIASEAWGVPEFQLEDVRFDRRSGSVAAVAAKPDRYAAVLNLLQGLAPLTLYNVGGTPIGPALVAGAIENNIEAVPVTLHDSAHLLPHQLLGGRISELDGTPLDYLAFYERNAVNLNPTHKPVPGYWARGGAA